MVVYIVIIALLIFIGPHNTLRLDGIHDDYTSRDNTDAIRGIFILLILASHFFNPSPQFTKPIDTMYWDVRVFLAQLVVSPFLFFSGYGMTEAIRRKGQPYVRDIPRTRVLRILFIYALIQVCFIILNIKLKNPLPPLYQIFLAIKSIGSDNWYIFDIILCYLFTWLAYLLFPKEEKYAVALSSFMIVGLISCFYLKEYAARYYNTLLCYAVGQWYSVFRTKIEKVCKNNWIYVAILFICGALFFLSYLHRKRLFFYEIHACLFALVIVLLEMKLILGNPFLRWCGRNLMSIFLVHRIPLTILREFDILDNIYLRFSVFWIASILLSIIFSRVIQEINKSPVFQAK